MRIKVKVIPNARERKLEKVSDREYRVYVRSPPERGRANRELVWVLAKRFGVPTSRVRIVKGLTSRNKLVEIEE